MQGRWFLTPHAVRRYQERAHAVPYEQARTELAELSLRAHYVRAGRDGTELWRGGKPLRLRFLVGPGTGTLPALITVEAEHDHR